MVARSHTSSGIENLLAHIMYVGIVLSDLSWHEMNVLYYAYEISIITTIIIIIIIIIDCESQVESLHILL
jgi:hypothetical protein